METFRFSSARSLASLAGLTAIAALTGVPLACGSSSTSKGDGGGDDDGGESSGSGGNAGSRAGSGGAMTGGRGGSSGRGGTGAASGEGGEAGSGASNAGGASGEAGAPQGGSSGEGGAGGEPGSGGEGGEGGSPAGASCDAILEAAPSAASGIFVLDPDGPGGAAPFPVVCDMTTDGGGWTLALHVNSVNDGLYATFGSGYVNLDALATTPEASSSNVGSPEGVGGWLDLNLFPYAELRLAGYRNGVQEYTTEAVDRTTLRIPFGQNGYYLYDDVNGYYWCGGSASFTNDGTGQVNQPSGAPADCKSHTSLGDGWDFGTTAPNAGLTVCGGGSRLMTAFPGSGFIYYPTPGAAQAIWVR